MNFSLSWLPEVLRSAGLKVAEQPGWLTRGRAEMGTVRGVICHHTGTPRSLKNMPTLNSLTEGVVQRSGKRLPGPLAQLGLGRDGTYYVVAAGRCNHAGEGAWQGLTDGNGHFIGIEAENAGDDSDPWPDVQLDAYRRGVAAILKHVGAGKDFCCAHREYALPKGRKDDPHGIDMDDFRSKVGALIMGTGVVLHPVIPAVDAHLRPTLKRGSRGEFVRIAQTAVGVEPDGVFGPATEAAVRSFQRSAGLVPDGIVGPKTWQALPAPGSVARAPASSTTSPAEAPVPVPVPARMAWGKKVSADFRQEVVTICHELGMEPDHLMACMAFETGRTFSPKQQNAAGSGAIGLIQFMPSTAQGLGTSTEALRSMTAVEQLAFVKKYFLPKKGKLKNLGDVYMTILWPDAVGKADGHALFTKGQEPVRRYIQNQGLDLNKDGVITRAEACAKVQKALEEGLLPENCFGK